MIFFGSFLAIIGSVFMILGGLHKNIWLNVGLMCEIAGIITLKITMKDQFYWRGNINV